MHSSTRHDVTDTPHATETVDAHGNKEYVDDIVKSETITNENVFKVKFTPVPFDLDSMSVLQKPRPITPIKYLKDDYQDLHSYKIVNSLFKDKFLSPSDLGGTDKNERVADSPVMRGHSPLANLIVSEHLTKIDGYLQESLNLCSESQTIKNVPTLIKTDLETAKVAQEIKETKEDIDEVSNVVGYINNNANYNSNEDSNLYESRDVNGKSKTKSKLNSVQATHPGVLSAIYNMPMHYHAAVLCFLLIVYNLVYQYIKQNCHGKNQTVSITK